MKAYSGPEGLKLWVLRVGPEKNKEVLLKYFGIDHPWNGNVFKAKFQAHGDTGQNYILDLEGNEYTTLVARTLWDGSELHYEAYLKGGPEGVRVSYDENVDLISVCAPGILRSVPLLDWFAIDYVLMINSIGQWVIEIKGLVLRGEAAKPLMIPSQPAK